MKLNKYDYKLLEFLQTQGKSSLKTILKRFPDNKYGTKYRLLLLTSDNIEILSERKSLHYPHELKNINNESYIIAYSNSESFEITSRGVKSILEYKLLKRKSFFKYLDDFLFKILPLLISAGAVYVSYLALKIR